ncbi:MAG: SDR family NAD(P)-dependent oxidoreductase [Armatimonadia bacterium]|nr:SDR family NAD(P)-dependent oxidoreductase [Armatimonadia bacterium]
MRIIVTGGAGFIGSTLVDRLLDMGHEVGCLDNFDEYYSPAAKRRNIEPALQHPAYRLFEGDLRDQSDVRELLEEVQPDAVVHIAARAGVRPSLEEPRIYVDVNIHGTLNLLDAARDTCQPHLLIASTSSVYGAETEVPFREDAPLTSIVSPYAASKLGMEAMCHTYSQVYDLPIHVFRLFTVYGPRQRPDMAIHKFTRMILEGETIQLYAHGETYRDYTYVDDIVDGFVRGIGYDASPWGVFNLGGGRPTYLTDLVAEIEKALGKEAKVEKAPPADGDVPRTLADISRAREHLGYDPKVTIPEGVPKFVEWYLSREG